MTHLINWLEIPVTDFNRALNFYSAILQTDFHQVEMGESLYALFPSNDKFNCGALVKGAHYIPSADGITVYLNGGKNLELILNRVSEAGGQVIMNKTFLGEEVGYIGMFIDTEGNKIGLQHL